MVNYEPHPRRKLLHESIQDQVKHYIIERGYRSGDPLPAESELARELGISRPSLREAIRALQTLGVIETRHGTGTFVGNFSLIPLIDGLAFNIQIRSEESAIQTIRELLQIREILERYLVAQVALEIPDSAIDELETIVQKMEARARSHQEFSKEDRVFHQVLYRHMGNPLIVQLVQAFWDVFDRLRGELPGVIGDLGSVVEHHRRILEAVRQRDGNAATRAMTAHFDELRHRVGEPDGPL